MTNSPEAKLKVLFVDDDRAFLDTVRQTFEALSQSTWEIHVAADAAATSLVLKQHPIDLAVLDVRMPEISGLQLMSILNREYPDMLKVLLTGVADESDRLAGLESGAELYLEKPADVTGLQSIYATLNELVKWHRKQGSRGTLRRAGLLDLVKLECVSGNSRLFEVFAADVRGQIYIKEGSIVHADTPGRRGQSAFTYLATLPNAEFNLRQFMEPPERSISRQWEFLFLEATQLQEQLNQAAAEAKAKEKAAAAAKAPSEERLVIRGTQPFAAPASAKSPTPVVPTPPGRPVAPTQPPAAPEPESPLTPSLKRRSALEPAPSTVPSPPELAQQDRAVGVSPAGPRKPPSPPEPLQLRLVRPMLGPAPEPPVPEAEESFVLKSAPVGPLQPPERGPQEVRIEEMLVCSKQREVLYEWQCRQTELRLRLVEGAREKSVQMGNHLPLGAFDRLETQATDGRLVIQFQGDSAILFRSGTGSEQSTLGGSVFHQSMSGWLARHAKIRGLLGCGVIRPAQPVISQSCAREFPREPLNVAWRCVQDVFELLDQQPFAAWQVRWIYERAQLYVTRRADGKALAMFLSKDPQVLDVSSVERVFAEFKSLEAM